MFLEFARDQDVKGIEYDIDREKNRKRRICIGNCRLLDVKLEKPGNYEITPPPVSFIYFLFD